jgi:outer membrane murein-binding lipoprotein Lpp
MRPYKKIMLSVILSGLFLFAGCMEMGQPFDTALRPAETGQKTDAAAVNRFQDVDDDGPTPMESAIELSKKYAALSEEAGKLKVEKQDLISENRQLTQQVAALQAEAEQAKKELAEANDLLIEMRIELNNWKTDVLGFRDEMRQADKAQLETLLKILKVLGGEAAADLSPDQASEDKDT